VITPARDRNAGGKEQMTGPSRLDGSRPGAGRYEIRLQGHLDNRWAAWFDDLSLTHQSDGTTVLSGLVIDQSALHGLLQKVRDTGQPLISVTDIGLDELDVRG
jgi:hypothetical protein